ncbi:MAG: hypothetical protein A2942_03320 [Candidatus Lloydbacteria bacterium RIFCSPLOWO2_01_FULL_50_20]|uniref:Uncharacterized protein n=1 Tax=Candidatus Lloydbacteria bacterium RIFCSPLOWO2_01_FULL_50_20 TaxID=1798665 RepID=A0A1G2DH33_9BACT|nr:MAG: hypothetical protein A3C13_03905 [Candidatus Lloydbacteria bacterium RIFCSPHIGHO2_02_FULL_50_11]OGZ12984.1 MAG: hypothetical protein A2942_03320 [Candidatus Lloydbacteria bacterium RIFCSPLOWO2_01_FULL_50_20]
MINTNHAIQKKGDPVKNTEHVYAEINKEVAKLMTDADKIVFGPTPDFEYKVPLEDFKKSLQEKPH